MKKLLALLVLSIFIFNWMGYQLYRAIHDEYASRSLILNIKPIDLKESTPLSGRMTGFKISFFVKDVDFDDLFEFTATPNYSVNEIFFNMPENLFLNHANKENQFRSFKCFNGEYYSRPDKLFANYPHIYSSRITPDRYLLNIPIVFLSPKDHPPQLIG